MSVTSEASENGDFGTQTENAHSDKGTRTYCNNKIVTVTLTESGTSQQPEHCSTQTQFEPESTCERGTCCSGREVEELLSPSFAEDLKTFLYSMQFELKPGFSLEDIRRYYDARPQARNFAENGFARDLPQSHHAISVKEYVIGQALKHTTVSAVEWSVALGGPRRALWKRHVRQRLKCFRFLMRNSSKNIWDDS